LFHHCVYFRRDSATNNATIIPINAPIPEIIEPVKTERRRLKNLFQSAFIIKREAKKATKEEIITVKKTMCNMNKKQIGRLCRRNIRSSSTLMPKQL
jgi:hypothetical protein